MAPWSWFSPKVVFSLPKGGVGSLRGDIVPFKKLSLLWCVCERERKRGG